MQQYVLRQDVFESQALSFSDATTQQGLAIYKFAFVIHILHFTKFLQIDFLIHSENYKNIS